MNVRCENSNEYLDSKRNKTELLRERCFVHEKLREWQLEEYIDAFDRKYCLLCVANYYMHTIILSKSFIVSSFFTGEQINEPFSFLNVSNEVVANKLIKLAGPYTRFIIEREKLKKSQVSIFIVTFLYYIYFLLHIYVIYMSYTSYTYFNCSIKRDIVRHYSFHLPYCLSFFI